MSRRGRPIQYPIKLTIASTQCLHDEHDDSHRRCRQGWVCHGLGLGLNWNVRLGLGRRLVVTQVHNQKQLKTALPMPSTTRCLRTITQEPLPNKSKQYNAGVSSLFTFPSKAKATNSGLVFYLPPVCQFASLPVCLFVFQDNTWSVGPPRWYINHIYPYISDISSKCCIHNGVRLSSKVHHVFRVRNSPIFSLWYFLSFEIFMRCPTMKTFSCHWHWWSPKTRTSSWNAQIQFHTFGGYDKIATLAQVK